MRVETYHKHSLWLVRVLFALSLVCFQGSLQAHAMQDSAAATLDQSAPRLDIPSIVVGPDGNVWFIDQTDKQIGRLSPQGALTFFPFPDISGNLDQLVPGPNGTLWFSSYNALNTITKAGVMRRFPLPSILSYESNIGAVTKGPEGNIWFTTRNPLSIGRMTSQGTVTRYMLSPKDFPDSFGDFGITSGPDGALWFFNSENKKIGRITTQGQISVFTLPFPGTMGSASKITSGSDRNIWFTVSIAHIGRITPSGRITEYPTSLTNGDITTLVSAADGNLWFSTGTRIGRMTTAGNITWFQLPAGSSTIQALTDGPDHRLWFTEQDSNIIGSITYQGAFQEYHLSAPQIADREPDAITAGSDGNLWFTEKSQGKVVRMTPQGKLTSFLFPHTTSTLSADLISGMVVGPDKNLWLAGLRTIYKVSPQGSVTPLEPQDFSPQLLVAGITAAPNGNLWFMDMNKPSSIGFTTPAGIFKRFSLPYKGNFDGVLPGNWSGITLGADSNIWFIETRNGVIGRVTPQGVIKDFQVSRENQASIITALASGADGNIWFLTAEENGTTHVGRMTLNGVVTEYSLPPKSAKDRISFFRLPTITRGPDGNMWFTETTTNKIGRISPAGIITEFSLSSDSIPIGLTAGPEKSVWFTDMGKNVIGRITVDGKITEFPIFHPSTVQVTLTAPLQLTPTSLSTTHA